MLKILVFALLAGCSVYPVPPCKEGPRGPSGDCPPPPAAAIEKKNV